MDARTPCPVPFDASIGAIRHEGHALDDILDAMRGPWHARRTRLGERTLGELIGHLAATVALDFVIAETPEMDWLEFWHRGGPRDGGLHGRPEQLIAAFNAGWPAFTEAAEQLGPGHVVRTPYGGMRLDHHITARVVELVVHGLDIRAALGLEEVATPPGIAVTCAVLDGLRDSPRPAAFADDPIAYILDATGRSGAPADDTSE